MTATTEPRHPCPYCGTMLDEDDCVESDIPAVNGPTLHSDGQCREYVYCALQSYKHELVQARAEVERLTREGNEARARSDAAEAETVRRIVAMIRHCSRGSLERGELEFEAYGLALAYAIESGSWKETET